SFSIMLRRIALKTLQTAAVRRLINAWCNSVAPVQAPWFEQPDAEETIKEFTTQSEIDHADAERLGQWARDGYFVVRNAVPTSDIDEIGVLIDGLASAKRPIMGLKLLGIREPEHSAFIDITHREFLERYALEDR